VDGDGDGGGCWDDGWRVAVSTGPPNVLRELCSTGSHVDSTVSRIFTLAGAGGCDEQDAGGGGEGGRGGNAGPGVAPGNKTTGTPQPHRKRGGEKGPLRIGDEARAAILLLTSTPPSPPSPPFLPLASIGTDAVAAGAAGHCCSAALS